MSPMLVCSVAVIVLVLVEVVVVAIAEVEDAEAEPGCVAPSDVRGFCAGSVLPFKNQYPPPNTIITATTLKIIFHMHSSISKNFYTRLNYKILV